MEVYTSCEVKGFELRFRKPLPSEMEEVTSFVHADGVGQACSHLARSCCFKDDRRTLEDLTKEHPSLSVAIGDALINKVQEDLPALDLK